MGLWAGRRRQRLVHDLRSHMRLLLREDPGRERMVELVRLFDPDSHPAGAGRICVDAQRRMYLPRSSLVDPGTAVGAQVPPDLPVAYFVQLEGRSAPLDVAGAKRELQELRESAILLLNGLAIRLGGLAWPPPKVASDPLQATVYTPRPVSAAEVLGVVERYVRELVPYEDVSLGSIGVDSWRTPDGRLQAEHLSGQATLLLMHPPAALGEELTHGDVLAGADAARRSFMRRRNLLIDPGELGRGLLPDLPGFGPSPLPDLLVGRRPLLLSGFGGAGRRPFGLRAGLAVRLIWTPCRAAVSAWVSSAFSISDRATASPPVISLTWPITAASAPPASASRLHDAANADAADPCQPPGSSLVSCPARRSSAVVTSVVAGT